MNKIQKQIIWGVIVFQFVVCATIVLYATLTQYFSWVMIGQMYANASLR